MGGGGLLSSSTPWGPGGCGQDLSLAPPTTVGSGQVLCVQVSLWLGKKISIEVPRGRHHWEGRDGHGPAGELLSARGSPQVDSRPWRQGHRPKLADWGNPGRATWPASTQLCDPGGH